MTPAIDITERRSKLTAAKRDFLEQRLRGRAASAAVPPSVISPCARQPRSALSSAQQRMWFFGELDPTSPVYNVPAAMRLTGPLDVAALRAALDRIVARHEILRTTFVAENGEPAQVVADAAAAAFTEIDLAGRADRDAALPRLLVEEFRRPFDLARGPMMRTTLIRLGPDESVLTVVLHHIASDLWSWEIFLRELGVLYETFASGQPDRLPSLPIQYADYAAWEQSSLHRPALEQQRAYWKEKLAGAPALLELPTDRPRPAVMTFRGALARRPLPPALVGSLQALSRREGVTLFTTLLAAFKVLLFRTTHQPDVIVGTPTAGRTLPQTEPLIGLFVNTLALRSDLGGDPTFQSLLQQVRNTSLEALSNQDLPFDKLVEELKPLRSPGYSPLVQIMFTLQAAMSEGARLTGLTVTPVEADPGTARFDLTLVAEQTAAGLDLVLEYNTDLYDEATARRTLGNFHTLLDGVVAEPEQRISRLPLLTAAERRQLLDEWNATQIDFPPAASLPELFETQVAARPHSEALVVGSQRFTYGELNARADQWAAHLRALGVGPEARVAILLERSAEMIAALLGVLKAGGAYVPVDPAYPKNRQEFILQDSRAGVVITDRRRFSSPPGEDFQVVSVEEVTAEPAAGHWETMPSPPEQPGERDLAYIIYTSGSSGQPKGVAIEHRNAIAFVRWAATVFSARELDGVLAATSICFDLSIFEIFVPLSWGGKIILAENALALRHLPAANEVRLVNTVPSVMAELLRSGGLPPSVETVNLAGEPLSADLVRQVCARPHIQRVYDLYGPTETTTYSTWTRREPRSPATIGRPIANTDVYVLDAHLQPVPVGVTGELFIGGAGVTRGYLNRPLLTAERFIAHPFSRDPEARLYRTGDLCRYRPDGQLVYLGRSDEQIKVRGFRIEPAEIESALRMHTAVSDAVVVAREDMPGERRLVAYITTRLASAQTGELRTFLQHTLPDAMIPTAFVALDSLPRTANGKVDRRALPAPEIVPGVTRPYVAPRDELETQLAQTWESVLGVSPVGVTDRFFDLGGHSLLAVRLTAQIEKALGRPLSVAALFQAPSVEQLAALIRAGDKAGAPSSLLALQPNGARRPLFLAHGMGGGNLWGYANLARGLGEDQPVYAFKPCEPERLAEFPTIEKMAAHYVAEMRRVQPEGPYRLGGYCFGGNVAYEMARLLEAQGEQVSLLALLNAWPSNAGHDRLKWTPLAAVKFAANACYWATRWCQWTSHTRGQFFSWKARTLKKKISRWLKRPAAPAGDDVNLFVDLSDVPVREQKLWQAHLEALNRYHPQPYGGKVTLLRTTGYPFFCSFDRAHGWRELARGGVTVRFVPGMHETIMIEPNVQALARELQKHLDADQRMTTGTSETNSVDIRTRPTLTGALSAPPRHSGIPG